MVESRVLQIVRQFWENAIKLLLENPKNVGDLLALAGADVVKRIDLRRVELIRTTFVERDYRHVESDVVLVAPLRRRKGERTAKRLLIYILIEHQSEPDRLMPLRSVDYVVQIFKYQVREWSKTHGSSARIRLYPGEPILGGKVMNWDDASGSLKVPKGYRAVSVKVTMEASVSSLIEPGDHVDVIVVVQRSQDTPSMAKTILRAVQVFAVNSQMAKSQDKDKTLEEVRTVSLLVDPDQAEKLSMGQDLGTIRLALRSPGDEMADETMGCTLDRLLGRGDVADADAGHAELPGQTEAADAAEEPTSPSPEQDGWTMIVDSPAQTKEYRLGMPGQTPRLTGVKDKNAAPNPLAAAPASPEPPEAPIPADSATAVEASGSEQPIPRQEATASFRL